MGRRLVRWTAILGLGFPAFVLSLDEAGAATQFNWNSALSGDRSWNVNGNWDQAGFPNGATHVANLSVPLSSTLNVGLGNESETVAGLTLGGTSSTVTTILQSNAAGLLVFQNDDATLNGGIPLVTSGGVAGSTNVISANVRLNEQLDFSAASTNNVVVSGAVTAAGTTPSIRSFMPAGLAARIESLDVSDPNDSTNNRRFRLNDSAGSPPGMPAISTQGTLEFDNIGGFGELSIGVTSGQHPVPLATVILHHLDYFYGYVQLNRANVVLASDFALGSYGVFGGQPNQGVGMNLLSDDDNRQIYVPVELSQWFTIKGEHSLTWTNIVAQSNTRGWINLLPVGKTFTLGDGQYAVADEDTERTFTFDGTGRTVVNGGLHDKYVFNQGPASDGLGHFRKSGTGTVFVRYTVSSYHGSTIVEAGSLRFDSAAHLANTGSIVSTGGALGVDTGFFSNPVLVAKLDAADTGGIMLAPTEAAMNLDFTAAPLANAANVSVAAPEDGITYTGAITPNNNIYRLGGGSGTLTLPNTNQLTGSRGLMVTNGGEVVLGAKNNYSGPTVVSDYAFTSRTNQAIADTTTGISQSLFAPTTLTVASLKSGGVDSSIGNSSNDAANLTIRGSTLRIDGETDKIQRLFTVGVRGATIETVGATRAFFENPGAIVMEPAGATASRTLVLVAESAVNGMHPLIQDAADGDSVGLTKSGIGTWELFGDNSYSGPTLVRQGQLNVNGTQTGTGETVVEVGAKLGGIGTVGGNVALRGIISPGRSTGTFHIGGNLTLDDTSETLIEITNVTPGSFDRIEVAGNAQLNGTLHVELSSPVGPAYNPKLGDVFPFLAVSGGAGGMFDHFDLPALAEGLAWELNPGNVTVFLNVIAALAGDYNFNGVVDAADYTVWRDSLGQHGIGLAADGDRNQVVDELDYAVWKSQFGTMLAGAGQSAYETVPAPEPACLPILAVLVVGFIPRCLPLGSRRRSGR